MIGRVNVSIRRPVAPLVAKPVLLERISSSCVLLVQRREPQKNIKWAARCAITVLLCGAEE
jgi:hypothetical protein